jgi:hypothetical protein
MDHQLPLEADRVNRLIILVPADWDYTAATRRIWELAIAASARVQFLGLCKSVEQEPALRRQLAMMSAMLADGRVFTEVKVEIGSNWVDAVKRNYQTGDMIACFAEQRAGLFHRPLSQILESNLKTTVYILSGLCPQKPSMKKQLFDAVAWIGSSFIIIGAFALQARISLLPADGVQTILWILSVVVEFWLLLSWNNQFD